MAEVPWTHEVDVAIVGGGGAGMAAAIAATDAAPDADVLVLQKLGDLGGATTMSQGVITAAGTSLQDRAGVDDDPELHFHDVERIVETYQHEPGEHRYLDIGNRENLLERDNRELRRTWVQRAGETVDWLQELGCEFAGPYPRPGMSVPRSHQIVPPESGPSARAYTDALGACLGERGITVECNVEAYELAHLDGRVQGVLARKEGQTSPMVVEAASGVVLATGGYVNSEQLREEYTSDSTSPPINAHNSGDGHEMAREVGAQLVNMDVQWLMLNAGDPYYIRPQLPRLANRGAIFVDGSGARFVDEEADYEALYRATRKLADGSLYVVLDRDVAEAFSEWPNYISTYGQDGTLWAYLEEYVDSPYGERAERLPELAERLGMDARTLQDTVDRYNGGTTDDHAGRPFDPFGRTSVATLDSSPFYAIGPLTPSVYITDGGVAVDDRFAVLAADGSPIDGLYAAGVMAGDVHLFGAGHHLSWTFTSGRTAGREVVSDS